MGFQLAQVIKPQFVSNGLSALTLVTGVGSVPTTGTVVPAQVQLSLWTCRFTNVSGSPVILEIVRLTAGGSLGAQYITLSPITIPPPTFNAPYFEWDPHYQMYPGDAIYASAGAVNALVVTGDGGITI